MSDKRYPIFDSAYIGGEDIIIVKTGENDPWELFAEIKFDNGRDIETTTERLIKFMHEHGFRP